MGNEVRKGLGLVVVAAVVWLIGLSIGSGVDPAVGQQQVARLLSGAAALLAVGGLIVIAVGLLRDPNRE